jgi:hypothetical protein
MRCVYAAYPRGLLRGVAYSLPHQLEPFPSRLNEIVVIASEAWPSIGFDSNEPVGSPRFARDDGVST